MQAQAIAAVGIDAAAARAEHPDTPKGGDPTSDGRL